MIKETVTYKDFDGNEQTDVLYFNLTRAELSELQFSVEGGFKAYVQKIVESKDSKEIFTTFKKILLMSYGEKSADGKCFTKSEEIRNKFENSAAYDELLMTILQDENKAAALINGIIPERVDIRNEDAVNN